MASDERTTLTITVPTTHLTPQQLETAKNQIATNSHPNYHEITQVDLDKMTALENKINNCKERWQQSTLGSEELLKLTKEEVSLCLASFLLKDKLQKIVNSADYWIIHPDTQQLLLTVDI